MSNLTLKVTGRRAGRVVETQTQVFGGPVDWDVSGNLSRDLHGR
jgi:hypothetical protein